LERLRLAARPDVLDDFRQNESLGKCHIVLFVSRVEAGRRLDLLVRAMQQVVARDPLALLVIVGDGALVTGLRRLADEQGVGGKVRFVAGTYSEEILSRWFMVSRVFVAPEALGLNVLHAFGYGLPVITSDNARVHSPEFEYLRPGVNGLLYRAGSPQQLATQILKILDSDSLQSKLASGARATVAGNGVTMPRMVQAFAAAVRLASDGLPTNPAITQAPT
jgi:glycosyltransferase involved in cell wall biosynthesis